MEVTLPSISQISQLLKQSVSQDLYAHSERVRETARSYAKGMKIDEDKAALAGLLHDCAKELSNEELLRIARENEIHIFEEDEQEPNELHARVGAIIAKEKYGIIDPQVIEGIRCHTFGETQMGDVAKITLIADDIEPERKEKYAKPVREALKKNGLDYGLLVALNIKMLRAGAKLKPIHPLLIEARNFFVSKLKELISKQGYRIELEF